MATGTRNKRTMKQEMRAKLSSRVDQQATRLADLVHFAETIEECQVGAAQAVEDLKELGLTLSEIEAATGLSVYRLGTFGRLARQNSEANAEDDSSDESNDGADAGSSEDEGSAADVSEENAGSLARPDEHSE